jgi:hypothetical protein
MNKLKQKIGFFNIKNKLKILSNKDKYLAKYKNKEKGKYILIFPL